MKTKHAARLFTSLIAIFILIFAFACKEEEKTDPCEESIAPEKTIHLDVTVYVKTSTGGPKTDEFVTVRFERHPCGASAAEVYTTQGNTDADGKLVCNQVSIMLKNTDDDAFVTATAPNLNSSVKYSNRTFHYDDFDDGEVKSVEMIIQEGAD